MEDISFQRLPREYQSAIDDIANKDLKKIFNQFVFLYLDLSKSKRNNSKIEIFLYNYLSKFKFITFSSQITINHNFSVICVEKKCLIIDKIEREIIKSILKRTNSSFIYINEIMQNNSNESKNILTEMENFRSYFSNCEHFNDNLFVNSTICTISVYLIRRFFCPTIFFEDPSFFSFNQTNSQPDKDFIIKMNNLLKEKNIEDIQNNDIMDLFDEKNESNQVKHFNFNANEFIELRHIHSKEDMYYYLVYHINSQYIFLMKKFTHNENLSENIKHEIEFCDKYYNRCFVKFYGFIQNNYSENKIGLIYEYVSNGDLKTFIENNNEKITPLFSFMTMNRIFQGILYLYSNSLIHCDLKPSNILLDHDYTPYISDNETIREFFYIQDKYFKNIGSMSYSSPEQLSGNMISLYSDVFSFGLILYFLFEHKHLINSYNQRDNLKNSDFILPNISNCTENIIEIFKKCIKLNPNERLSHYLIKIKIYDEIISSNYIELYFGNEKSQQVLKEMPQYLFENIYMLHYKLKQEKNKFKQLNFESIDHDELQSMLKEYEEKNAEKLKNYFYDHYKTILLKLKEINEYKQFALNNYGILFYLGLGVKQNYLEAKKYFELSADLNVISSFNNLGFMHLKGKGINKNYAKAKEYYEKSAKFDDSEALFNLGYLFFNGYGVEEDIEKSIKFLSKSEKQNNTKSINLLGLIYLYGKGIHQNFGMSLKYFEKAAKLNSSDANVALGYMNSMSLGLKAYYKKAEKLFKKSIEKNNPFGYYLLAKFYKNDHGIIGNIDYVKQNYQEVVKCFEKAASLGYYDALHLLGNLYFYGKGVPKDYKKAKEYYQKAANHLVRSSLYKLAIFYEKGIEVDVDYFKAKMFYELAGKNGYYSAYIILGNYFYNGEYFDIDEEKAIFYYKQNIKSGDSDLLFFEKDGYYKRRENRGYYQAHNDLGLIFLFQGKKDLAIKHLEIANSDEYQFAQNNYALLFDPTIKNDFEKSFVIAEKIYTKVCKQHFPLAEYNYGHMLETMNNYKIAYEFYEKASEDENNPFIFHRKKKIDKRLSISISFIILYVDCKLFINYLSCEEKSYKYFTKIIKKLQSNDENNSLKQIKNMFLELLFLREDNTTLNSIFLGDNKYFNYEEKSKTFLTTNFNHEEIFKKKINGNSSEEIYLVSAPHASIKKEEISKMKTNKDILMTSKNPLLLYKLMKEDERIKQSFIQKIKEVINFMHDKMYTPPFYILFGRISISKQINLTKSQVVNGENLNRNFYDGFGKDLMP